MDVWNANDGWIKLRSAGHQKNIKPSFDRFGLLCSHSNFRSRGNDPCPIVESHRGLEWVHNSCWHSFGWNGHGRPYKRFKGTREARGLDALSRYKNWDNARHFYLGSRMVTFYIRTNNCDSYSSCDAMCCFSRCSCQTLWWRCEHSDSNYFRNISRGIRVNATMARFCF